MKLVHVNGNHQFQWVSNVINVCKYKHDSKNNDEISCAEEDKHFNNASWAWFLAYLSAWLASVQQHAVVFARKQLITLMTDTQITKPV